MVVCFLCGGRFAGPHERTHELAFYLQSDSIDIDTSAGEKFSCVLYAIDPCRLQVDLFEANVCQFPAILLLFEGSRDTVNPQFNVVANWRWHLASHHHIRDCEATPRSEHAESFRQDTVLVTGQVDDTVRDNDIDRVVRQRNLFDLTLEKLDIFNSGLALILVARTSL